MAHVYDKYLREDKIDDVLIPDNIFVNPGDERRFSKKQIIKYIRDAFNHNINNNYVKVVSNLDNNKYNIAFEINKHDSNPIPFHIIIDGKQLFRLSHSLYCNNTFTVSSIINNNIEDNSSIDNILNNTVYRKYYSDRMLPDGSINKLRNLNSKNYDFEEDKDDYVNNVLEHADYNFSISQNNKIKTDYNYWTTIFFDGKYDKRILRHCIGSAMPLSIEKLKTFIIGFIFYTYYLDDPTKCLSDLEEDINKYFFYNDSKLKEQFKFYTDAVSNPVDLILDGWDLNNLFSLLNSIYFSYMFDTMVSDSTITINNKQYEKRHLRNTFVHLRWFYTNSLSYRCFDWGNSRNAEFNPNDNTFWKGQFKYTDLWDFTEQFLKDYSLHNCNIPRPPTNNRTLT